LFLSIVYRKRIYLFFGFIVFIPIFSFIWIIIFTKYSCENFFNFILEKIPYSCFFDKNYFDLIFIIYFPFDVLYGKFLTILL